MKKLFGALAACTGVVAFASGIPAGESSTITSVYGLETLFVDQQLAFLPIAPPSEKVYLHPYGRVLPVDWKEFPKEFARQMVAEMDANGFPIYRITIYEDPATRETVFLNAYGTEAYRLPPEKDYNPYAWQVDTFRITATAELDSWYQWIYDPAHIAAEFLLIPEIFHADYEASLQELATRELSLEPMSMMMSLPAIVTNLLLAINNTTNGALELELRWPDSFTNELEIFATDDLVGHVWQVVHTGIATACATNYLWTDWGSTNASTRFYVSSNADVDSDEDGLADGREIYLYGSKYDDPDSDDDGLDDDEEVGASPPTDPSNGDRTLPVVYIASPVNDIVVVP